MTLVNLVFNILLPPRMLTRPLLILGFCVMTAVAQERADSSAANVRRSRATIEVSSVPSGAQTFLDSMAVGTTPITLQDVAYGRHVVRLELAGYAPFLDTLDLRFGSIHRIAPRLLRTGSIDITSEPPGIRAFLADTVVGFTPVRVSGLRPGRVSIRIEDPVFRSFKSSIIIPEGDTARVQARLEQAFALLTVQTDNPAAVVQVDGKEVGTGPFEGLQVPSGMHGLRIHDPATGQSTSGVAYLKPGGQVTATIPFSSFQWQPIAASLVIPGSGQMLDGAWLRGLVFCGGFISASAGALTLADDARTKLDAYNEARRRYLSETTSETRLVALRKDAQRRYTDAVNARNWLIGSVALAMAIYAWNVYDVATDHAYGPSLQISADVPTGTGAGWPLDRNVRLLVEVPW